MNRKFLILSLLVFVTSATMVACHFDMFDTLRNGESSDIGSRPENTSNTGESRKAFSGDFATGKALELVYGDFDAVTRRARWKLSEAETAKFKFPLKSSQVVTEAVFAQPISVSATNDNAKRYYVLTRTMPVSGTCKDCSPVLGGAIFEKKGSEWVLVSDQKLIVALDKADEWRVTDINFGLAQPGIRLHWVLTENGITEEGDMLLAIEPKGFEVVFKRLTAGNNRVACDQLGISGPTCWRNQSTLTFVKGTNNDFDDLVVNTRGTRINEEDQLIQINETVKYRFADGHYQAMR